CEGDGNGMHVERDHRLLPRGEGRCAARGGRRGARGLRRRGRRRRARREGSRLVPRESLRRVGGARPRHAGRPRHDRRGMKLHALVEDLDTARVAVEGGATVIQWRLKDVLTLEVVERGRSTRSLCARHDVTFVVNDDVEAALMLGADGVHLGRADEGAERAKEQGMVLGLSAASVDEARAASLADYIGVGPVWATPSKTDADPPIGLDGLGEICRAVSVPVVAIGGIDASNAADCIGAGAAGVAVIRAARNAAALRKLVDQALVAGGDGTSNDSGPERETFLAPAALASCPARATRAPSPPPGPTRRTSPAPPP